MATQPWRRRIVTDMLFGIEGSGWYAPELREAGGFRWSGPGHLSVLRIALPEGAGRGEAHCLLIDPEALPEVSVFLNGHRLGATVRRLGTGAVLDFAWDAAAMVSAARGEFWFHCARLRHLPSPQQGMRSVGFRLSTLVLEPAEAGPETPRDALALIAGRRFLDTYLPVASGRARLAFLSDGAARLLDMRLEAARLGPTAQPHVAIALREEEGALALTLAAPGATARKATLSAAGVLALPVDLSARDAMLVARLMAALPAAYGAWLDEAMHRAAPDVELLAQWRRALARLALAAEAWLASALADGPDPFAADLAVGFAWG
ncbi:hypothetical protein KPL78_12655 [Roseomonas sp. HJA6]|uniref:Uncharacterized protein n=1 Tax=Roseomonas alba TaxID=2846776 RepID=A0ABS7A8V4_9PROT|nr:hypothetical protein [Neoroseomonas alba]MBW6398706.1 hypothetical protein [Neoroseomonas alba]